MDFGSDVNSDVNSSFDISLDFDVWRSRICKQGHSSLVRVVGGWRRFHEVVHDVTFQSRGSFLPSSWMGGLVPLRRICAGVVVGGNVASRLSLEAAQYSVRRGLEVHLSFSNDFLWWSCRLGRCSFSARLLFRFLFCLEALWCQVVSEEDVLALLSLQAAPAAEFVALEFLALFQEASVNICRARTVHGAEGGVQRVLVHGACLVSC